MPMAEYPLNEQGLPEGYPLQAEWEVTPRQVRALAEAGEEFLLIDVREPRELAAASLSAEALPSVDLVCVPMGEIPSRISELNAHAKDKVVVMCHHGARSLRVTAFLRQQGFEEVRSMAGGIDLWSRDIDPQVPRY